MQPKLLAYYGASNSYNPVFMPKEIQIEIYSYWQNQKKKLLFVYV